MAHETRPQPASDRPSLPERLKRLLFGKPRDLEDRSLFQHLSLVPFLAWVGLGADGLSSSCYGPEEAFRTLGGHTYLAVGLASLMAVTVFVIAAAYSRIIEEFPHGGGGYVVATKLLGDRYGVVSGSALLVDYVLTITVSVAAAGDALFSFLPPGWHGAKLVFEVAAIAGLTTLNIRGVKESVVALLPIFLVFLITHLVVVVAGILTHVPEIGATAVSVRTGFREGLATLGAGGMLLLFAHAYSLGGGTYTGIEAVSNGMAIMREPRVHNGRRTMFYMAASLAFTAGGLLVCYLLWHVTLVPGKTMNAVLLENLVGNRPLGRGFVIVTLFSEGALLVVAAQAGFLDGPRVLANMAVDSWVPRRFAALSERLTTSNGIVLMGAASLAALVYTGGDVRHLVVMYSINVFLTFSLSMFAMARAWCRRRNESARWKGRFALFTAGFLMCALILALTVLEKFTEGGWITLLATGSLVAACYSIRRHYRTVGSKLAELYDQLGSVPCAADAPHLAPDPRKATAVVMVGSYGGLGIHTVLNIFRAFPGHFKNLVFVSIGVIDSGGFKGEDSVDALKATTEETLERYLQLSFGLGIPAAYRYAIGTDAVAEAEKLCREIAQEYHGCTFFAGKVIFQRERWYQKFLHNDTAYAVQKRLQWVGLTMVILPARLREA